MRMEQLRKRDVAAMAVLANDAAVSPRCRQCRARGAQRLAFSPCAVQVPGRMT
jgi:hypothetical protein